jgi:hypothetical protein
VAGIVAMEDNQFENLPSMALKKAKSLPICKWLAVVVGIVCCRSWLLQPYDVRWAEGEKTRDVLVRAGFWEDRDKTIRKAAAVDFIMDYEQEKEDERWRAWNRSQGLKDGEFPASTSALPFSEHSDRYWEFEEHDSEQSQERFDMYWTGGSGADFESSLALPAEPAADDEEQAVLTTWRDFAAGVQVTLNLTWFLVDSVAFAVFLSLMILWRRNAGADERPYQKVSEQDKRGVLRQLPNLVSKSETSVPEDSLADQQISAEPTDSQSGNEVWQTCSEAGMMAYKVGDYAQAEKLLHEALREAEREGAHQSRLLQSLSSLADVYEAQGKQVQALDLHLRLLDVRAALLRSGQE